MARLYPDTRVRLRKYAKREGIDCALALDRLVPAMKRNHEVAPCNFCGEVMPEWRSQSPKHSPGCVLYKRNAKT